MAESTTFSGVRGSFTDSNDDDDVLDEEDPNAEEVYRDAPRALLPMSPFKFFGVTCNTHRNPLTDLAWDADQAQYVVVAVHNNTSNATTRRRLNPTAASEIIAIGDPHRNLQSNPNGQRPANFTGRQCHCAPAPNLYYCPQDTIHCKYIKDDTEMLSCIGESPNRSFQQYAAPLALFWLALMVWLCFASARGRYARRYLRKLYCCWDEARYQANLEETMDELLRRARLEHAQRQRYRQDAADPASPLQSFMSSSRRRIRWTNHRPVRRTPSSSVELTTTAPQQPQSVYLKTRRLESRETASVSQDVSTAASSTSSMISSSSTMNNNNDNRDNNLASSSAEEGIDDDPTAAAADCAICLGPLQPRDRVGDQGCCSHVFHADCLKGWIQQRKNHCPLCHAEPLATRANPSSRDAALE